MEGLFHKHILNLVFSGAFQNLSVDLYIWYKEWTYHNMGFWSIITPYLHLF